MNDQLLYPNIRQYFAESFWAIRPNTLDLMCDVLQMRANGILLSQEEIAARIGTQQPRKAVSSGSIALIPLQGVIDQKVSMMSQISGGTAVNDFMDSVRQAMADSSVSAIILDVDSPGGSVSGIQEAANEILSMRGKKPIIAVADPTIASAAYWLACAADEIVCMPSGMVGSIGVIAVHDDFSEANKMGGYVPTYITYGQYKAEGNPDMPLSDDAKAYKQSQIDSVGAAFTQFVAKARKVPVDTVRSEFGQGRMLLAKDALAVKMIDSIGTLDQTIQRLSRPVPAGAAKAISFPDVYGVNYALLAKIAECANGDDDYAETIAEACNELRLTALGFIQTMRSADAEDRGSVTLLLDQYPDPTLQFSPQGLMADTKRAAEAMQSCATRWAERKSLRMERKAMKPEDALTKSNLDALKSADAAISGLIDTLEDAKSSLASMDSKAITPVATTPVAAGLPSKEALQALAEYEIIRARNFGVQI